MTAKPYRILILATIVLTFFPLTAKAQKRNIPVDKPISKSNIPTESKSVSLDKPNQHSTLELAVVEEINLARSNPQEFVGFLKEYRKATKGNVLALPDRIPMKMTEGGSVIDEAIGEMNSVSNLKALEISDQLSEAARMQLKDLQEDASLGHKGKNGSTLKIRLAQFATVEGKSAENICYYGKAARDVVMIFLIDDGVQSRMHRKNVVNPAFKKMGVACGIGKNNESLCVTVFAENLKDVISASSIVEF